MRRHGVDALAVAAVLAFAGCETNATRSPAIDTIGDIADRLVASLERRRDVHNLRVAVQRVECAVCAAPRKQRTTLTRFAYHQHVEGLDAMLERELVVALAPRLELVEAKQQPATAPVRAEEASASSGGGDGPSPAPALAADAILAADYTRTGDQLYLSVRILDAETRVVLAAARGVIEGR